MLKLSVDFEHPSRTWWESGGQALWDGITEGFGETSVILEEHLAESWLAEARRIPGWEGGPEWAPHPIGVSPVADDDPEA